MRRWSTPEAGLTLAVWGIVLGPYTTVGLDFHRSLVVQAVIVLASVTVCVTAGLSRREGWENVAALPRLVLVGGALWAAAAVLGTAVALARGNELRLVAGQLFAMGLLPVGIAAAGAVRPEARNAVFVRALGGSILVAIGAHLVYPVYLAMTGGSPLHSNRLYLPNAVSVAGVIVIALMLAAARVLADAGRARRLAAVAVAIFAAYVVGTGTRSLWAAAALGVTVFVVLELVTGPRARGVRVLVAAGVGIAVCVSGALAAAWYAPRHEVLPQAFPEPPFWTIPVEAQMTVGTDGGLEVQLPPARSSDEALDRVLSVGYPVDTTEPLFFSAEASGGGMGTRLVLRFETADGEPCHHVGFALPPTDRWVRVARPVLRAPANAPVVSVRLIRPAEAGPTPLRLRGVSLSAYDPLLPAAVHRQLVFITDRIVSTVNALRWGEASSLPSLRYRIVETRAVLDAFGSAPWHRRLLGHGLGARYALDELGFSATGVPMRMGNPNYIHDLYAFLLYKLGFVGTLLVAIAIGCWLATAWRRLRQARGTAGAHEPIAVLAIWATYLVWAVLSPELVDFRVAPIVGMMVAVTARVGRTGATL